MSDKERLYELLRIYDTTEVLAREITDMLGGEYCGIRKDSLLGKTCKSVVTLINDIAASQGADVVENTEDYYRVVYDIGRSEQERIDWIYNNH